MTPICAEQGIASPNSAVVMSRSRRDPTIRVETTAIVTQPTPTISGTTARPLSPIRPSPLSVNTASRGRTPASSSVPITT